MNDLSAKLQAYDRERRDFFAYCDTEEQTKISLINPYLELLGFDVRNPKSVRLEFQTGIGRGVERIDYAIIHDDKPIILIEAKSAATPLSNPTATPQIQRYAQDVQSCLFAVLTNGKLYKWYQKDKNGRLEPYPFITIDAFAPKPADSQFLSNLADNPASSSTIKAADQAKGQSLFSDWFQELLTNPSNDLLRLAMRETGRRLISAKTEDVRAQFTAACAQTRAQWLDERLSLAKGTEFQPQQESPTQQAPDKSASRQCSLAINGHADPIKFKNASDLLIYVIQYSAEKHSAGPDNFLQTMEVELQRKGGLPLMIHSNEYASSPNKNRYTSASYLNKHLYKNMDNTRKQKLIHQILDLCHPAIPDNSIRVDIPNA